MNKDDFMRQFPNASISTIRANFPDFVQRTGPAPTPVVQSPVKAKERQATRKKSTSTTKAPTSDEFYHRHSQNASALLERNLRDGPLAARKVEGGNPVRFLVFVTSFRRRLLDEDNLCEKYVVDCCRYAGLIPGDAPETTSITTRQQKVTRAEDERTEVVIVENEVGQTDLPLTGPS